MIKQWIELFEHTVRDTITGSETSYPLPVMGSLKPKFTPTDEPRKEFRGGDTGQGDLEVRRLESQWTHTLECYAYPIRAIGLLLKHALGNVDTRAVIDTSAQKGIITPENLPFGDGQTLGDKALGIIVNYDDGKGGTASRKYYGGRLTKFSLNGDGSGEEKISFEIQGPGSCIGAIGVAGAAPDFSTLPAPFCASDTLFYIGSGISRTGVAPNFTDLGQNTMIQFIPDSFSLDIELGRADKVVRNGIKGPSKTTKEGQLAVSFSAPVDLEDPSSGFSSRDEVDALISDVRTTSLLIIFDNGELAGALTQNYQWFIDLPLLYLKPADEAFDTEGKSPSTSLEFSGLYSKTTEYQAGILTIDKEATY